MTSRSCTVLALLSAVWLCGCTTQETYQNEYVKEAQVTDKTRAGAILEKLPPAREKIAVSLYDFQDMTGQFKYNDKYSDFSSAVTKGGLSILMKALLDASNKRWFTVTERSGLKNLLQERQIIKVMRGEYRASDGAKLPDLPPLVYGGMLLEGGIIGYDSNVITGGAGAIYLGIGGNTRYARDVITVYLRAVNIQTGEVMMSVTSSKTIFSTAMNANVLKYITFDKLLQAEAGFSLNEPVMLATRQAIETAVYSMIMEGAIEGLWSFADEGAGQRAISEYMARRDNQNTLPSEKEERIFERAMEQDEAVLRRPQPDSAVMAAATTPVEAAPAPQPQAVPQPQPQPAPQAQPMRQPQQQQEQWLNAQNAAAAQQRPVSNQISSEVAGWGQNQQGAQAAAYQPQPSQQRYATAREEPQRQRPKDNYYHLVY